MPPLRDEWEADCAFGCFVTLTERCAHGRIARQCSRPDCTQPSEVGKAEIDQGMPALCAAHFETAGYEKGT